MDKMEGEKVSILKRLLEVPRNSLTLDIFQKVLDFGSLSFTVAGIHVMPPVKRRAKGETDYADIYGFGFFNDGKVKVKSVERDTYPLIRKLLIGGWTTDLAVGATTNPEVKRFLKTGREIIEEMTDQRLTIVAEDRLLSPAAYNLRVLPREQAEEIEESGINDKTFGTEIWKKRRKNRGLR